VQKLRSEVDCIIVGARTARLDNPKLTVRMPDNSDSERQPLRAVIDPYLTTRPDSELARGGKTILYCLNESLGDAKHFDSDSIEIVPVSCIEDTIAKLSLTAVMQDLNKRGMRRVLSEGGGVLAGGLLDEDLVDQLYWFVATKVIGRSSGIARRWRALNAAVCLMPSCLKTLLSSLIILIFYLQL
jgi:diaminohydroxyphosphoribosylaminopyrimidine deaminase/5-amino-6-(5-phosphoribosylamino)uracil reductase